MREGNSGREESEKKNKTKRQRTGVNEPAIMNGGIYKKKG